MKLALYITLMLPLLSPQQQGPPLKQLRSLYRYAVTDKDSSAKLLQLTTTVDSSAAPILSCYKGVAQVLQARFTGSPFSKFKKFNAGKLIMENAIVRDTLNVEMRLLRYNIQANAPAFLGYNGSLQKDGAFLRANRYKLDDTDLKLMVNKALAAPKSK
ncbi:hypothetical protein [Mucilaginibacter sp. OK283]|uniref:hypothetical protein n=1 Tax=Mucilaginibacter sp. OK283 TaxID=1881049 RepID=UPI0008B9FD85|nr:hypothetical protein [Mucilaginibacter sp. OK283]SEP44713.1 hypothetical protein SAMN05428947_12055 [Mucilaginibacter sp. OK283]